MPSTFIFDGASLSLSQLEAIAANPVVADLSRSAWERVGQGRALLEQAMAAGQPVYGATTGVGALRDVEVAEKDAAAEGLRLLTCEATVFPGPAFPEPVVRAALAILINNFAIGRSAVRPLLVEKLLGLLACETLPKVTQATSFGVADLAPLSQLALGLIEQSGLTLAPKEAVSLIDNNAFGLAEAALAIQETVRIAATFDAIGALSLEGFRANLSVYGDSVASELRHPGQAQSLSRIAAALQGSRLWKKGAARFLQDPLSFRSLAQTNGALHDALTWATTVLEQAINQPVDNPQIDLASGQVVTSSSMVITLPTLAMDTVRQALARAAQHSHERAIKQQTASFSGLPQGLAEEGAPHGGLNNILVNFIAAARLADLLTLAAPVLLTTVGQMSSGIEDVTSHLPLAARRCEQVLELAWEILAVEMMLAVWAIVRRQLATEELGCGARAALAQVRARLPIGREGEAPFDLVPLVELLRSADFRTSLGA